MEQIVKFTKENKYVVVGSATVLLATGAFIYKTKFLKKQPKVYKKDVVYVADFPGKNKDLPSYSPFVLKVISMLEYNNIEYQVDNSGELGPNPKGKLPFIRYNDKFVYDSSFIIDWICSEFKHVKENMDKSISQSNEADQAINHITKRFVDEAVSYLSAYIRWVVPEYNDLIIPRLLSSIENPLMKSFLKKVITSSSVKNYTAHGIGKFSLDEVITFAKADFESLSALLGSKKFLFGDYISLADISLFSTLAQIYFVTVDTPIRLLLIEKQNLVNYIENVKKSIFDDSKWESLLFKTDCKKQN